MNKSNVIALEGREASADRLTEVLRTGARQLIQQAPKYSPYLSRFTHHAILKCLVCIDGNKSSVLR